MIGLRPAAIAGLLAAMMLTACASATEGPSQSAADVPPNAAHVASPSPQRDSSSGQAWADGTILDLPDAGISLQEALDKVGVGVSLPDEATAGKPVKVMLIPGPDGEQGGANGLAIRYDTGVDFYATPSSADEALSDLRPWQSADKGSPFVDGRGQAFDLSTINGRTTAVQRGGEQMSEVRGRVTVRPSVEWRSAGFEYNLTTEKGSVGQLLDIARDMK